jgi:hypothetical protein
MNYHPFTYINSIWKLVMLCFPKIYSVSGFVEELDLMKDSSFLKKYAES